MRKILTLSVFLLLLLSSVLFAHNAKNHKPYKCIPQEQLTKAQLSNQKTWNYLHLLTKNQQHCLLLELEKEKKNNSCPKNISYGHTLSNRTKLYLEANKNSDIISDLDKNQEVLFISENKNWAYVSTKVSDECVEGFVESKLLIKKGGVDKVISVGDSLISITDPAWAEQDKLILVNAEGTISIEGAVAEGKIDQIIINGDEENILSNNSFAYLTFVPKAGKEIRIIGNKNGKKVKELTFVVKVGN